MTMAIYKYGKPVMVKNLPTVAYIAGDVLVFNNSVFVAHQDNPMFSGGSLTVDALAAGGGVYTIPADAAYAVGAFVYWHTGLQQVTGTYVPGLTFPFGTIVAGPLGNANDAGPTGSGSLCDVLHSPLAAVLSPLPAVQPLANFRNLIDGGDFTVAPFQRGTSQAADITNTTTYGPDRFAFLAGAGSALDWSKVADATIAGFSQSLKMQRKAANADLTVLKMGQVLETVDSIRAQGQPITISFWAKKGANYSGGVLTVQVESSTGTDQSAANLFGGTWTAQAHVVNATQALGTGFVRYEFTGTVPATCTQLGVTFAWTPTGAAGADDSVSFMGIQLEIGAGASPFEHRDVQVELEICQRYFFQINEPAASVIVGAGMISVTNAETVFIPLPVQMRTAPTVTVAAGSFKFNIAGTATAVGGGFAAGTTHTPNYISVVGAVTATVGQATLLQGGGGAGTVAASADF